MNMQRWTRWITCSTFLVGCAHSPPAELLDARKAYDQAEHGAAATDAPTELHDAHEALTEAEAAFKEGESESEIRDLSYVASRKARTAEMSAAEAKAERDAAMARKAANVADRQAVGTLKDALAGEQQKRAQAEDRESEAWQRVAQLARVEKTSRGTTITLAGSLLFESGKAVLLPGAEQNLSQISAALVTAQPDAVIVVEGHTDSQGAARFNQTLSEQRAQAVRQYFVQHGIAENRVQARGMGEDHPIAPNTTPEGRADNRRVEITVEPSGSSSTTTSAQQPGMAPP